jgi:Holliday junction DNA helicase RuvA
VFTNGAGICGRGRLTRCFVIDFVEGTLAEKQPTRVVVQCGGIGLEVLIPLTTHDLLPLPGSRTRLLTIHHARDNGQFLFGFATREERHLFRLLTSVSGVGPRIALAILSHHPVLAVTAAIAQGDTSSLQRTPGVGSKLASRIVNELRHAELPSASHPETGASSVEAAVLHDAEAALKSLGFSPAEARRSVAAAAQANPAACTDITALVRAAISS